MKSSRSRPRRKKTVPTRTATNQRSRPPAAGHNAAAASGVPSEKLSNVETASLQRLAEIIGSLQTAQTTINVVVLQLQQLHDLAAKLTANQNEPCRPCYVQ